MPLDLNIVSPEKVLLQTDADFVRLEAVNGSLGILPGHANMAAKLKRSEVAYDIKGKRDKISIEGGFAKISADKVTVFTD